MGLAYAFILLVIYFILSILGISVYEYFQQHSDKDL